MVSVRGGCYTRIVVSGRFITTLRQRWAYRSADRPNANILVPSPELHTPTIELSERDEWERQLQVPPPPAPR
jgi:hypothetical protein